MRSDFSFETVFGTLSRLADGGVELNVYDVTAAALDQSYQQAQAAAAAEAEAAAKAAAEEVEKAAKEAASRVIHAVDHMARSVRKAFKKIHIHW